MVLPMQQPLRDQLSDFCRRNGVARLAVFGSALRDDFGPNNDVDLLVEFLPGREVGLIGLAGLEIELSRIVGRRVDLNTPGSFRQELRKRITSEASVLYDLAR